MILSTRPLYLVPVLVATLLLGGCATYPTIRYYTVEPPTPKKIQKRVRPGQKVIITTKVDKDYVLHVTQVTSEAVIGTTLSEEKKELTIPIEEIETMKVERVETAQSRNLMEGAMHVVWVVLLILLLIAAA